MELLRPGQPGATEPMQCCAAVAAGLAVDVSAYLSVHRYETSMDYFVLVIEILFVLMVRPDSVLKPLLLCPPATDLRK